MAELSVALLVDASRAAAQSAREKKCLDVRGKKTYPSLRNGTNWTSIPDMYMATQHTIISHRQVWANRARPKNRTSTRCFRVVCAVVSH